MKVPNYPDYNVLVFPGGVIRIEDSETNIIWGGMSPESNFTDFCQTLIEIYLESKKKEGVLQFMHRNAESCRVAATDEINTTFLAELAAAEFNLDAALDDETHWIWELSLEVAESPVHS